MADRAQSEPSRAGRRVRLQRVLAAAGVAARRAAEEMIEQGRVEVNGQVVSRLPAFVDPDEDRITVDGRPLAKPQRPVYIMVNKPERMLAVAADEPGADRATVLELVDHPARPRLFPVGRLDWNTTGLVLLTNDGELANRLTHPRYGVGKTYRAVVRGEMDDAGAAELERQIAKAVRKDDRLAGRARRGAAGRLEIQVEGYDQGRTVLLITVREGRTGNIAKMLTGAGASVRKLERVAIGPLELRGLPRGGWRELERWEVNALRTATRPGGGEAGGKKAAGKPLKKVGRKPNIRTGGKPTRRADDRPRRGGTGRGKPAGGAPAAQRRSAGGVPARRRRSR